MPNGIIFFCAQKGEAQGPRQCCELECCNDTEITDSVFAFLE